MSGEMLLEEPPEGSAKEEAGEDAATEAKEQKEMGKNPKGKEAKRAKVKKVMGEWKSGNLKDRGGNPITDRDQAIAVSLSEAGLSKKK